MNRTDDQIIKRRFQSSYLTTLVSITLVLFMLGLLGLILLQSKRLSNYVRENLSIRIIFHEGTREADILRFQKDLDIREYTKYTEYITPDEAARQMEALLGEDFIGFLGGNPLPPSIDVYLKGDFTTLTTIENLEKEIMQNTRVKEVYYQRSLIEAINRNIRRISLILLGFSALLLLIAVALINNTIRLSVYSRRFLIRTMQLVGATHWFISRPFVFMGLMQGIYSAIIAIILLIGVVYLAVVQVPDLILLRDPILMGFLFGFVILLGALISAISTSLAVRKYLRIRTENLYG